MKTSQLLQVVLISVFAAVPGMAASPAVGSDAPLSLCGGDKAEKAESEKTDKTDTTVKTEKKTDKKNAKEDKSAPKGSA
jgi:hypothetical protein